MWRRSEPKPRLSPFPPHQSFVVDVRKVKNAPPEEAARDFVQGVKGNIHVEYHLYAREAAVAAGAGNIVKRKA
jgi:hypothetical protein